MKRDRKSTKREIVFRFYDAQGREVTEDGFVEAAKKEGRK